MFSFLRKTESVEYNLRLEDVLIDEEPIICIFSEKGGITPLKLEIEEIFYNVNLLRNVHPETIISLKKIHDMRNISKKNLKLLSVINQNEFEVCYDGKFKTKISGKDFCSNLSLASMMDIKDVMTVIYNTAYSEAFSTFMNLTKEKIIDQEQKKDKKVEEFLRPPLSIVK